MNVFRPGGLELTEKAADIIGLSAEERVLDVGCGLGTSLLFLRDKYNIEAHGIDVHPHTAKKAACLLGGERVFCADACNLPFEGNKFHAVFMECVLTLLEDPVVALAEARRVLMPGGHLVISCLDGAETLLADGRIGRKALSCKLEDLGFEIVSLTDESGALRRFIAELIFEYDSIENYIAAASQELGAAVLSCNVPIKGTGYIQVIAKKI